MINIDKDLNLMNALFEVMRNDITVMSEHGDSEKSLELELINADLETLLQYAEIYL